MSQGGHSEQILFFALFYQSTPSCLKVVGGVGWWVAHVIIVSAPVQRIWFWGFLVLVRAFGSGLGDCWDGGLGLGLGLDNYSGGEHPQHEVQGLLWAGTNR